jgi:hypothetical protein
LARPGIINAVQFALDGRLAKSDDNGQLVAEEQYRRNRP